MWPLSSAIFTMDGYFHRMSWFSVNPWELSNSRSCLFHWRAQTCEPVSTEFKHVPVWVFQNLMCLSFPPPPEASRLLWKGHQARAFTAAVWSSSLWSQCLGEFEEAINLSHMKRRLSFPPLANCWPEADHFNPQTSCRCPSYDSTMCSLILTSLLMTLASFPPVVSKWWFQASDVTRNRWPPRSVLSCTNDTLIRNYQSDYITTKKEINDFQNKWKSYKPFD